MILKSHFMFLLDKFKTGKQWKTICFMMNYCLEQMGASFEAIYENVK